MTADLKRAGFPGIGELAEYLRRYVKPTLRHYGVKETDVRLQVHGGNWGVHTGDPCYDTDHRGFWGAETIDTRTNCRELARQLIDEALDAYYSAGGE